MLIYGIDAPTPEAAELAAILASQAEHLLEALRRLERIKGIEPHLREIHELEQRGGRPVARRHRGPVPAGDDPLGVIKWSEHLPGARGDDRRRRGHRRDHRADRRQGELTGRGTARPPGNPRQAGRRNT